MSSEKIVIEQVKSVAARTKWTKRTLAALGLGRIGKRSELPNNAAVKGMIQKVSHLVRVVDAK